MEITQINTILSKIQEEVFSQQGRGFTVEINPEITKYDEYISKCNLFAKDSKKFYSWRRVWFDSRWISEEEISFLHSGWKYSLPQSIAEMLPSGVILKKTAPQVLLNTTKKEPTSNTFNRAKYVEGRRVYLIVTDEYAQKLFKDVFSNVGYVFRDHLLSKQADLLKMMVNKYIQVNGFDEEKYCSFRIKSDGMVAHYKDTIKFNNMGKNDLKNLGEEYGFSLALIEIIKTTYPQLANGQVKLTAAFDYSVGISVEIRTNKSPKPMTLSNW